MSVLTDVAPFLTSEGTELEERDQNQTLMKELVRSIAYQPPPALLNAGPKLVVYGAYVTQPASELQSKDVEFLRATQSQETMW